MCAKEQKDSLFFSLDFIEGTQVSAVINLEGVLASDTVIGLMSRIDELVKTGCFSLSIDMAGVQTVSAGGIGAIIRISEKLKEYGGGIVLENIPQIVLEIFQLPGFNTYFKPSNRCLISP